MSTKHAVMYRCFVVDGDLKNHYTELLFDRSVDEEVIEKIALSKLNLPNGSLDHAEEEVVETNRYGQMYMQSLFVMIGLGDDIETTILDTSLKISRETYTKLVEAIEWLLRPNCFISSITSLGYTDFLRKSDINSVLKPLPVNYLSLRILSATQKYEFSDHKTLTDAIVGGSKTDQSLKTECIEYLEDLGLIHRVGNTLRPTELGALTLGTFEAPLDLDAKPDNTKTEKETIPAKEYANSGIEGLTPTGEHIMGVMAVEKQLTKTRLKKILKANEVYNLYGVVSKTVDLLVKKGLLAKENSDVNFKDMKDSDIITLSSGLPFEKQKDTREAFTLEFVRDNPRAFRAKVWERILEDTPKGQQPTLKTNSERFLKELTALGISVEPAGLTEAIKKPENFVKFIESYFA